MATASGEILESADDSLQYRHGCLEERSSALRCRVCRQRLRERLEGTWNSYRYVDILREDWYDREMLTINRVLGRFASRQFSRGKNTSPNGISTQRIFEGNSCRPNYLNALFVDKAAIIIEFQAKLVDIPGRPQNKKRISTELLRHLPVPLKSRDLLSGYFFVFSGRDNVLFRHNTSPWHD